MNETFGMAGASAALGVGMLIGLERERHKGTGDTRDSAGLRTFAITALLGYVAMRGGGCVAGRNGCDQSNDANEHRLLAESE
jgi:uncharacterized membrane protein YhiD involved in acid resistance